jgi:hypothetical protein
MVSQTFPNWTDELQEALWETGKDFGVQLEVSEQVAIARAVARQPADVATPEDLQAAFTAIQLPKPSVAYAKAVLASVRGVAPKKTLLDTLLGYRKFAIRALSRQFGGKTQGREDALRNNLWTYLQPRGYAEAHTGKGRTDILIPAPDDAIIEVKIWTNERTYKDGLVELARYIYTEQPKQAYMIVFGDRHPLPSIVADPHQARAADEQLEGLTVPVIVVPFEIDAPSKAAAHRRRRERGKR